MERITNAFIKREQELRQELATLDKKTEQYIYESKLKEVSDLFNDEKFIYFLEKRQNLTTVIKNFQKTIKNRQNSPLR